MKRLAHLALAAGVQILMSTSALALSGNEYRALSQVQRQAWLVGAIDGLLTAQLTTTNKQPGLAVCLSKIPVSQQQAIFEKALDADPERWNFPAAFKVLDVFNRYCDIK